VKAVQIPHHHHTDHVGADVVEHLLGRSRAS
jgi:hypothetical protein